MKKPSRRGFVNFIHSPQVILPSPKSRQTSSRSTFLSKYFAGWDDRNRGSISHFPADTKRHAQTSKPNCAWNISAGLSQKLSDRDRRSLLAPEFQVRAQDRADNYLVLPE